jgi:predicted DNA-binding transcriptional regulator AlpA
MSEQPPRRYLPDPQVCKRYGVTPMTLYRWDRDPRVNFPSPIRVNGRKYRDEQQLEGWERTRAARTQSVE